MFLPFLQFDESVFVWINTHWSNSFFDLLMLWITHLGDPTFVWLWIGGIGLLRVSQVERSTKTELSKRQKRRLSVRAGIFFCLFLALIYGVNAGVYSGLKQVFNRPRPFEQAKAMQVSLRVPSHLSGKGSFPSGHACNAFMVAAFLTECMRRKRFVFYGLAIWVALSRIYLGVHFPSDVFVGAFLGWGITRLMLSFHWLRNRIIRKDISLSQQMTTL